MDPAAMPALHARWDELLKDIEKFKRSYLRRHRMNFVTYAILMLSGLAMSVAITIAGILNLGLYAAVLGVCVGFIQGLQQLFPTGENAEFYRVIVAESENLIADLKYRGRSEDEFESVLDRFQALRAHTAMASPKGKGMESVKKMYDDLAGRSILSRLPSAHLSNRKVDATVQ